MVHAMNPAFWNPCCGVKHWIAQILVLLRLLSLDSAFCHPSAFHDVFFKVSIRGDNIYFASDSSFVLNWTIVQNVHFNQKHVNHQQNGFRYGIYIPISEWISPNDRDQQTSALWAFSIYRNIFLFFEIFSFRWSTQCWRNFDL